MVWEKIQQIFWRDVKFWGVRRNMRGLSLRLTLKVKGYRLGGYFSGREETMVPSKTVSDD